jgi:hypothetical protein
MTERFGRMRRRVEAAVLNGVREKGCDQDIE